MIHLRASTAADAAGMLSVARALPEWFNAHGLAELAGDLASHNAIVAEAGEGQVVGFATWIIPSPHTPEPELAELSWLAVTPAWRGRGIGRRLVAALTEACRSVGVHTIQVSTLADSVDYPPYAETRAFYRALGFADWRVDPDHYGDGEDRLLLRWAL